MDKGDSSGSDDDDDAVLQYGSDESSLQPMVRIHINFASHSMYLNTETVYSVMVRGIFQVPLEIHLFLNVSTFLLGHFFLLDKVTSDSFYSI